VREWIKSPAILITMTRNILVVLRVKSWAGVAKAVYMTTLKNYLHIFNPSCLADRCRKIKV
jgi:hypothetical protein